MAKEIVKTPQNRRVSYTGLKHFEKSPLHYMHYLSEPFTDTEATIKGNATDMMILTPGEEEFKKKFIVYEKFEKRTNEAKDRWAALVDQAQKEKKLLIPKEDLTQCELMAENVMNDSHAREILNECTFTQKKIEWIDFKTGLPCKGFIDFGNSDEFLGDLKTTRNGFPVDFHRTIIYDSYDIQAAFYLMGDYFLQKKEVRKFKENFYWITVDNVAPYAVGVHRASKELIQYGKQKVELLMKKFEICCREDNWTEHYGFHSLLGNFTVELPFHLKSKLSE